MASRIAVDLTMLILIITLECLSFTGITLHEWMGFALCPVALLHVIVEWDWFGSQVRKLMQSTFSRERANVFLNGLLLVLAAATLVSGLLISHQIVPLTGERLGRVYIWVWAHDSLNKPLLVLGGLHLALNWPTITSAFRRGLTKHSPAFAVLRGRGIARRSLPVMTAVFASALAAYLFFTTQALPPERWKGYTERSSNPLTASLPSNPIPERDGRVLSLHHGFEELEVVCGVLLVTVIAGRYILRLRL